MNTLQIPERFDTPETDSKGQRTKDHGQRPSLTAHRPSLRKALAAPGSLRPAGRKRRPSWRQRLVDAESGFKLGLRGDSILFVHFFTGSAILCTALVMGISIVEWCVVVLSLATVLAAELFHQVLKSLVEAVGHQFAEPARRPLRIAIAAVFVTMAGAVTALALIFGRRLIEIFGG